MAALGRGAPATDAPNLDVEDLERWTEAMAAASPDDEPDAVAAGDWWLRRYIFNRGRADVLRLLGNLRGARVLDVGSGFGLYAEELARAGASVVALEPVAALARFTAARVRRHDRGAQVLTATLAEAGLEEQSFDAVVFAGAAAQVHPDAHTPGVTGHELARAASLLRPGGRLLVLSENGHLTAALVRRVAPRRGPKRRRPDLLPHGARTPRALARLARGAGLEPGPPAYVIAELGWPRFVIANERSRSDGLGYMLRMLFSLRGRPGGALLERLASGPARRVLARRLAPAFALVAERPPATGATAAGERLIMSGSHPEGECSLVVAFGDRGEAVTFRKIGRNALAGAKLRDEHAGMERARPIWAPEFEVPEARIDADGALSMDVFPGRRLSAFLSGELDRGLVARYVEIARRLGSLAARSGRRLPVENVAWGTTLPADARAALATEARVAGITELDVGFSHNDFHPSNVLIAGDGRLGVVDWTYAGPDAPVAFDLIELLVATGDSFPDEPLDQDFGVIAALRRAFEAFAEASGSSLDELRACVPLLHSTRERQNAMRLHERMTGLAGGGEVTPSGRT